MNVSPPMSRARSSSLLVVIVILFGASVAWGALVSIKPVRIHLSASKRSELVELRNTGTEPARYQLGAHAWHETAAGEMKLQKTGDLIVFPSLLELQPGETRRIRVASSVPAGGRERTYRVVVEELPAAKKPGQVQVLTHLNVPVFVRPAKPTPQPTLKVGFRQGRLVVVVENEGNAYFKSESVRVVARSKQGTVLIEETLPGWYVLAGGRRVYGVESRSVCADLAEVTASLTTDHGKTSAVTRVEPGAACGT